jgi:hypothetical protein
MVSSTVYRGASLRRADQNVRPYTCYTSDCYTSDITRAINCECTSSTDGTFPPARP